MKYSLIIAVFLLGIAAGTNHTVVEDEPMAEEPEVVGKRAFSSPKESFYLMSDDKNSMEGSG